MPTDPGMGKRKRPPSVQGDARLAHTLPGLDTTRAALIIRKGMNAEIDSYSAFFENDHETPTGLEGYLQTRGIFDVHLVGLATDFCVNFSAVDAARLGFTVTVREEFCRAIDLDGSLAAAREGMREAGVRMG